MPTPIENNTTDLNSILTTVQNLPKPIIDVDYDSTTQALTQLRRGEDTYEPIGTLGLYSEVVWTNPSPNDNFAAQTVALSKSLADFKFAVIKFKYAPNSTTLLFNRTYATINYCNWDTNSGFYLVRRGVQFYEASCIFENATWWKSNLSDWATANWACIPLEIIFFR